MTRTTKHKPAVEEAIFPSKVTSSMKKTKKKKQKSPVSPVSSNNLSPDFKGHITAVKSEFDAIYASQGIDAIQDIDAPPFQVGKHHKRSLAVLMLCYYNGNRSLTYAELSSEMGVGEKTKDWQCKAWKDLKDHKYVVVDNHKKISLSPKGLQLATRYASDDELKDFKPAATIEEHHEKIKSKLIKAYPKGKSYGPKILDLLIANRDGPLMTKVELAASFNTIADSHGFFYGFKGTSNGVRAFFSMPSGRSLNIPFSPVHSMTECPTNEIIYRSSISTALQESGYLEFADKQKRTTTDEHCIDSSLLEAARKKKKFRPGGKLVRLVEDAVFPPHLGTNVAVTADTPTSSRL